MRKYQLPPLVGIVGLARSGKTTMVDMMMTHCQTFGIFHFASPIKEMLCNLGVPNHCLWGSTEDRNRPLDEFGGKSGRQLMQSLGTEWGRGMVDPDIWINRTLAAIDECHWPSSVVGDVRMPNELEALRAEGALIVHIRRGRENWWQRLRRRFGHRSERGLKPQRGEWVIENDGSLAELEAKILTLLKTECSYE